MSLNQLIKPKFQRISLLLKRNWLECFLILSIILVFVAPALLTKYWFWPDGFLEVIKFGEDTGVIGDTIGGTTAPIVGLLNAILLYVALRKQNQQIIDDKNERHYEKLTDSVKARFSQLELVGEKKEDSVPNSILDRPRKGQGALMLARLMFSDKEIVHENYSFDTLDYSDFSDECIEISKALRRALLKNLELRADFEEKVLNYQDLRRIDGKLQRFFESVKECGDKNPDGQVYTKYKGKSIVDRVKKMKVLSYYQPVLK